MVPIIRPSLFFSSEFSPTYRPLFFSVSNRNHRLFFIWLNFKILSCASRNTHYFFSWFRTPLPPPHPRTRTRTPTTCLLNDKTYSAVVPTTTDLSLRKCNANDSPLGKMFTGPIPPRRRFASERQYNIIGQRPT